MPGEHGFRFFPGFYKHVIDTMRRMPSFDGRTGGGSSGADDARRFHAVRQADVSHTVAVSPHRRRCRHAFARCASGVRAGHRAFTGRTGVFRRAHSGKSSPRAKERRIGEYERISWWEFIDAEPRSASYQKFLATGFTRSLVASKARKASARTVGDMFMQMMLTFLDPTSGSTDRLLDGPTNLVWIDPWLQLSSNRGVCSTFASPKS